MRLLGAAACISSFLIAGCGASLVMSPAAQRSATTNSPAATSPPAPRGATAGPARADLAVARQNAPGNPAGHAFVPAAAQAVDTSHPDHVIGNGTPASCTSAACHVQTPQHQSPVGHRR